MELKKQAEKYMCLLNAMPDVQHLRMFRLLFAFSIAAWARHGIHEAKLCVKLANGTIDENNAGVLKCVETVACTIPGFRQLERTFEEQLQWQPAFAMCATALFMDVWREQYSVKNADETQQTQHAVANFCTRFGFTID